VATVIYTRSLPPTAAVILSGTCNFIGVSLSTGAVAFGIIALLPVELILDVGSGPGFAMVFSLLTSAIIWNLGTWYLGLPASSSHTLIGSIVGVGLMNSYLSDHAFGDGINWGKVQDTGLALLISPLVGFFAAALLLVLAKTFIKDKSLFEEPPKEGKPPLPIRVLLWFTCAGVSFAHGSNDGQKGMGLIMLILIGIVPGAFALKMDTDAAVFHHLAATAPAVDAGLLPAGAGAGAPAPVPAASPAPDSRELGAAPDEVSAYLKTNGRLNDQTVPAIITLNDDVARRLAGVNRFSELTSAERRTLRTRIYLVSEGIGKLLKSNAVTDPANRKLLSGYRSDLDRLTKYIPTWVKVAVAFALGFGTMIGWKRIVVTVGEKIGKAHLTYAQGASAELVAMTTIAAADMYGLPVSTTHVLSSGVAGTMAANHSGLQMATLRNLLLAWVLTLPVCIFLGATLFAGGFYVVLHVFGLK
jgi:PiT family inorganic phosphate transporter